MTGNVLLLHGSGYYGEGVHGFTLPEFAPYLNSDVQSASWVVTSPAIGPDGTIYATRNRFPPGTEPSGVTAFSYPRTATPVRLWTEYREPCPNGHDEDDHVVAQNAHPVFAEGLLWVTFDRRHLGGRPCHHSEIAGLHPDTGDRLWGMRTAGCIAGAVAVGDGTIFSMVDDSAAEDGRPPVPLRLLAVDIATRRPRWTRSLPSAGAGRPVLAGSVVYLGTREGTVLAFNAATGDPCWTLDLGTAIDDRYVPGEDNPDLIVDEETAPAVLPADEMIYVRTRVGVVALRSPGGPPG